MNAHAGCLCGWWKQISKNIRQAGGEFAKWIYAVFLGAQDVETHRRLIYKQLRKSFLGEHVHTHTYKHTYTHAKNIQKKKKEERKDLIVFLIFSNVVILGFRTGSSPSFRTSIC